MNSTRTVRKKKPPRPPTLTFDQELELRCPECRCFPGVGKVLGVALLEGKRVVALELPCQRKKSRKRIIPV